MFIALLIACQPTDTTQVCFLRYPHKGSHIHNIKRQMSKLVFKSYMHFHKHSYKRHSLQQDKTCVFQLTKTPSILLLNYDTCFQYNNGFHHSDLTFWTYGQIFIKALISGMSWMTIFRTN